MKKVVVFLVVTLISSVSGTSSNVIPQEIQITDDEDVCQEDPAIYGNLIIWQDGRGIGSSGFWNFDIWGYDRSTGDENPIIAKELDQMNPAIHGRYIVWEEISINHPHWNQLFYCDMGPDHKFGTSDDKSRLLLASGFDKYLNAAIWGDIVVYERMEWIKQENYNELEHDIYGYNFETGEFPIAKNSNHQTNPAIYGNIVVWQELNGGSWDVYGRNYLTGEEVLRIERDFHQTNPAIYGNIVVWEDGLPGSTDIYAKNLLTGEEFDICTDNGDQSDVSIHGNIIVWVDSDSNQLYAYNLLTGNSFPITSSEGIKGNPAVYENIVVWQDERNGDHDIYYCDLSELWGEYPLVSDSAWQHSPAIHDGIVVWHDYRSGNADIYCYHPEIPPPACTEKGDQRYPAIYGDIAVWQDNRDGDYDIYYRKLSRLEEFQIPKDTEDHHPAIYGNIIVWQGYTEEIWPMSPSCLTNGDDWPANEDIDIDDIIVRNWDIYYYNIATEAYFQITSTAYSQERPAIYDKYIIWMDSRNGNWDIYGYYLGSNGTFEGKNDDSEEKEFQITTHKSTQVHPAIYDKYIIWMDSRNGNWDIYGYYLGSNGTFEGKNDDSEEKEFQITTNKSTQVYPAIWSDMIVWVDYRNGNADIYCSRLFLGIEFQITTDVRCQTRPAIWGNMIVWVDYRNGNADVYAFRFII